MSRVQGIIASGLSSAASGADLAKRDRASLTRAEAVAQEASERSGQIKRDERAGMPSDLGSSLGFGAGMGLVFGPVGFLVGAGITHMFNKKREAGVEAYANQEGKALASSLDRGRAALATALEAATTDQERAEVEMMQSEFEQYADLASHPDAATRGQGLVKALEVSGQLDAELDEWQTEREAASAREVERLSTQFNQFDNLRGDLMRESARFTAAREAWTSAHALAKRGSPTDDIALIYKMANINDPGAIVTEGDVTVLKASGSITEQMAAYYNQFILGKSQMDDNVRANIMATIDSLYSEQRDLQVERNNTFQEIGTAANLDPLYLQQLRVQVDPAEAGVIANTADYVPDSVTGRKRPPREVIGDNGQVFPNTAPERPGFFSKGVIGIGMAGNELATSVGRHLAGHTVRVDQDSGERFVVDTNGQIVEKLEPASKFENPNGDTIVRTETPNGPVFRNVTQERKSVHQPGLWQEGGYFDRRAREREVNE